MVFGLLRILEGYSLFSDPAGCYGGPLHQYLFPLTRSGKSPSSIHYGNVEATSSSCSQGLLPDDVTTENTYILLPLIHA
jgi:hypothetical protein